MSAPSSTQVVPSPEETMPVAIEQPQNKPEGKKSAMRKWLSLAFRLVCTIGLFVFLFQSVSWSSLLQNMSHLDDGVLLVAVMVGALGIVISCYQWQVLLDGEQIHVDLRRLVNLYFVGIAFNHFLPTGMGGDVIKAYYVGREGKNVAGSASAAMMSRITGFLGMLVISIPALFIWHGSFTRTLTLTYLLSCLAMCAALAMAVALVVLLPRVFKGKQIRWSFLTSIIKIGNAVLITIRRPRSISASILFGVLFHLSAALNYYAFSLALHMQVPVTFFLVAIPFVSLVAFLPLSINGFGLRESALVYMFSMVHVAPATSLLLVLLVDVQSLLFAAIGGCLYLIIERAQGRAQDRIQTQQTGTLSMKEASA